MRFGSLFAGIGGFDLGFERAGMECAWQVEIDEAASSVLSRHWPDAPNYKDVKNVTGQSPAVDLICGGFPCQDVSVAGKRAGLAGERSGLWFEFHRILSELTPRWVVVENVPGLLSSNGGADFAVILRGLVELRYGVAWRILDAQYFGVAQRRRRVFIVGHLGDGRAAEVLFEREGLPWDTAPSREAGQEVAGTFGSNAQGGFRTTDLDQIGAFIPTVARSRNAPSQPRYDGESETFVVGALSADSDGGAVGCNQSVDAGHVIFESRFARNGRGAPDTIAPPLKAESGQTGKGDGAPLVAFVQNTRDEVRLMNGDGQIAGALSAQPGMKQQNYITHDVVGALAVNAGTKRKHGDGGISSIQQYLSGHIQPFSSGVRRLTPVECERLQGFPDGWTDGQSDSKRYRQLGNAVAVPVAEWLGRQLMSVLETA